MKPYRVLFVCTGNTCRSPMAEHMLRQALADAGLTAQVASAGLRVRAAGEPADPQAADVLRVHGYSYQHQTRQFEPTMLAHYDLVIGLTSMHQWALSHLAPDKQAAAKVRLLGSYDPAAGAGWDVPDPAGGDISDYERVLGMLRAAMPGIVAAVQARSAGGGPLGQG